ncbi:MAG: hypothetical protein LBR87_04035 [Synergistaceae bacterium]|jgi:chromosome segregation ATPase|nr:hypothetical protein [Synergistaceae bacterium]
MIDSIVDIESGIDRIEAIVKSLREERDRARSEAEALRKSLDERELELLQIDEELQQTKRGFDEKIAEEGRARGELESRLTELAARIKNLLPLVDEYQPSDAPPLPSLKDTF